MSCRELVELVTEYLEGALPERDRRRFDDHLRRCPNCVAYVDQVRITVATLGRLREESLSPAARDELLDAFRGWRDRGS
jgi:anti-sigma factor RsiW